MYTPMSPTITPPLMLALSGGEGGSRRVSYVNAALSLLAPPPMILIPDCAKPLATMPANRTILLALYVLLMIRG